MKHIHISELKPGMRVVDPGLDWVNHPYLYMADEVVKSDAAVQKLIAEGYQEVYIDPERSATTPSAPECMAADNAIAGTGLAASLKPTVALDEELVSASRVHDDSVSYVRNFMRDMRAGKLDMQPASKLVESIADSLERNADALVTLSRLRRTDSYTYMHCVNVSVLTGLFARYQGQDRNSVFSAGLAGPFHDLGKSLVPQNILNAPRKLSAAEREIMNGHPTLGYEQLTTVPGVLPDVLLGALHHHEKLDGSGYPQGLSGEKISEIGGMIAVADIYDALTSKRVYKEAMYPHRALGIIYEMRDKDLRTDILVHFIRMLGVYPMGSVVELDDGTVGVVSASNVELPAKPVVTLVRDPEGRQMPHSLCDLAREGCTLSIVRCMAAESVNIDPAKVLDLPKE